MEKTEELATNPPDLWELILLYFEQGNSSGNYAPTTLRTWHSVFKRFLQLTMDTAIEKKLPILEIKINQWEKTHTITKAKVFPAEDWKKILQLDITPDSIVMIAYAIIGLAMAARGTEITYLNYDDVKKLLDDDGNLFYKIYFDRAKEDGPKSSERSFCFVTGKHEVHLLDIYLSAFISKEMKTGRLFRPLCKKDGKIVVKSTQPIGKNTLAQFGKKLAMLIGW